MSELATFQADFAKGLLGAITHPSIPAGPLSVYRNTAISGAVEALRANYPVVRALIGEAMFANAAVDYAVAQPPRSPILALYGRRFADWIEAKCWAAEIPYLADVARIERLHLEALFAQDAAPLASDALSGIAPEEWNVTHLQLHPATRLLWSDLPAMTIWLAHQRATPGPIDPVWRPEGALFSRPFSTVQAQILDAPAHRFLGGVRRGQSVAAAALDTSEIYPHADLGEVFRTLIEAGVFAAQIPTDRTV